MATKKEKTEVYTTGDGRKIELRRIDPVFLQSVISSVKMPKKPTYEARTASGRVETHPLDAEAAKDNEEDQKKWDYYQEELARATTLQTEVSLRALFLEGTVRPKKDFVPADWQRRMRIIGIDLPKDDDELWVTYLTFSLDADDIVAMSTIIMRMTGVSEEIIQEAEGSFRDPVHPDEGS